MLEVHPPHERVHGWRNFFIHLATGDEAIKIADRLQILQGQLIYLESQVKGLDGEYKKFLAAHPR